MIHIFAWWCNISLILQVLYFGDSLRADIFPTHEFTSWDPVSVLEEMECEGMVAIDWVKHEV